MGFKPKAGANIQDLGEIGQRGSDGREPQRIHVSGSAAVRAKRALRPDGNAALSGGTCFQQQGVQLVLELEPTLFELLKSDV